MKKELTILYWCDRKKTCNASPYCGAPNCELTQDKDHSVSWYDKEVPDKDILKEYFKKESKTVWVEKIKYKPEF